MKNSWLKEANSSGFSIYNLPYGVFSGAERGTRVGVAIGDSVLDLFELAGLGYLDGVVREREVFQSKSLNAFISLGPKVWSNTRRRLQELLEEGNDSLKPRASQILIPRSSVRLHMPVEVGDYTDFYSSIEHATNVGRMFRPDNPLLPNWKHLPVAYHGRASSIVVSGTDIVRPKGQFVHPGSEVPEFGPSSRLDFELELAFVVGRTTALGETVAVNDAEEAIFGVCLFNDWSARDIQKWEYVPLGPFLGKSFASSVSPWIVPLEALEPFRVGGPEQDPPVLEYLRSPGQHNFDLNLEVAIAPQNSEPTVVCRTNFKDMYWSMAQQLAHHTCNGCNVRVGDIMASGTISGKDKSSFGSLLELSWGGKEPLELGEGQHRTFLQDGDTVIMRGGAERDGIKIDLGEVRGTIVPSR